MTVTPTGTPDWSKPLPGGARTLINDAPTYGAGGYASGWIDCTAFNGLFLSLTGIDGNAADFFDLQVAFRDASGAVLPAPTYNAVLRGDLNTQLNIPVMGADVQVSIIQTVGVHAGTVFNISMIGHGGGGSASYRPAQGVIALVDNLTIPNGATHNEFSTILCEGPATVMAFCAGAQPGIVSVWAYDNTGAGKLIFRESALAAGAAGTWPLWLPPEPVRLDVSNTGVAPDSYYAALTLGRN